MSVINLIPHRISFLETEPGYEDDNGDWHEGEERWGESIPCHAVGGGKANTITYADGTTSTYTYTVGRLPKDMREVSKGERVKLEILGIESEFTVKGFLRLQLQSKIWL